MFRCCIPNCVVTTGEYTGRIASFALKHPVFGKTPEEKKHRQNLMNIVTGIIDTLRGQPIELQIYRELANICERHFRPEDLKICSKSNKKMKRLKVGALPLFNMPLMTHKQRLRQKRWTPPHILTQQPRPKKTKSSHSTQTDEKYDFSNNISNFDVIKQMNKTVEDTTETLPMGETIIYPQNIRGEDDLSGKRKLMSFSDSMWAIIVKLKQLCITLYTDLADNYAEVHYEEIKSLFYEIFEIDEMYKKKQVEICRQNLGLEDEEECTPKKERCDESIVNPITAIDEETNQNEGSLESGKLPQLAPVDIQESKKPALKRKRQINKKKNVRQLNARKILHKIKTDIKNKHNVQNIQDSIISRPNNKITDEMEEASTGNYLKPLSATSSTSLQVCQINARKILHKIETDTKNKQNVKNIQDSTGNNKSTHVMEEVSTTSAGNTLKPLSATVSTSPPPPPAIDVDRPPPAVSVVGKLGRPRPRCTPEELKYYLKQKVSHPQWGCAYKCDICCKLYQTWSKLKRHDKQTHTKKGHTKCNICNKLIIKSAINDHIVTHTRVKKFTCEKCGRKFGTRTHYQKHVRSLIACRFPNFQCKVCDEKVYTETRFEKHFTDKHIGTDGVCEDCDQVYSRACILRKHHVIPLKPYKCAYCGELFTLPANLVKHMKASHRDRILQDNIWNNCPFCPKISVLPYDLKMHIMSAHANKGTPQHMCDYCGCAGNGVPWLKKHLNVKHGIVN